MKIEIPFFNIPWKRLFLLRYLIPSALVFGLLYWACFERPYLRLESAIVKAPYLEVRADRSGSLSAVFYREGERVKKGDALYSFTSEDADHVQKELQSTLSHLQDQLTHVLGNVEQAMDEYLSARAQVEMGLISPDLAEQPLMSLQTNQTEANEYRKEIQKTKADLNLLGRELAQKTIRSGVNGVIVQKEKREGDIVEFGDTIYSLYDLTQLWVEVVVPEARIGKVALGQKARIALSAYPKNFLTGSVSWISPVALEQGQGVVIRILLDDANQEFLRPNLSAQVTLKIR